MHHLVWFRSDLRIHDNPALSAACASAGSDDARVSAIYYLCPEQARQHRQAPIQLDFIRRNLLELAAQLAHLGISMQLVTVDSFEDIAGHLARQVESENITAIFCNQEPGVNEQQRDHAVQNLLSVPLRIHQSDCILPPGSVTNGQGEMYRVYTPFAKSWLQQLQHQGYRLSPPPAPRGRVAAASTLTWPTTSAVDLQLTDSSAWPAGEEAALRRLQSFCNQQLHHYAEQRDFPARHGTSGLSPYLAIGVLSARQCVAALEQTLGYLPGGRGDSGFAWLNELIWREFYRHLLHGYPRLSKNRAFKPETERLAWRNDHNAFQRWCSGETGFPIVDAAMRCLNQSGWMHNRLRMICASFLTKDLQIDWRQGEEYFMSKLIDGDLASNNGGWQWSASTGADAAPWFRIFNPTTQGQKFDPQGNFIRHWLPELQSVPLNQLHQPSRWLQQHDPGNPYPLPIVDHKQARLETLAMFKALNQ